MALLQLPFVELMVENPPFSLDQFFHFDSATAKVLVLYFS